MATYTCPTCNAKMERDMLLFYRHTDQHVLDVIKEQNPDWVTEDGFCPKCVDFFKRQMGKSGVFGVRKIMNPSLVNIGVGGVRLRTVIGVVSLAAAIGVFLVLNAHDAPKIWRLFLFLPFLGGMLGLIQAREQICVLFGRRGTQNMAGKEEPISDKGLRKALRQSSQKIIVLSTLLALTLTGIAWIL